MDDGLENRYLGKGIDEGIKETVVAFNLMGFQTVQSCEGHTDHGMLTPWVEVEGPNKPNLQFIGEEEIRQRVAAAHGITMEALMTEGSTAAMLARIDVGTVARANGETEAYKIWRIETEKNKRCNGTFAG